MEWVEWFPIVMLPFKIIVVGVGMYYSIKWHHDQDKKKREEEEQRNRKAAESLPTHP
ncbi:hypothetical protein G6L28_05345 [Agrobacterium larrymoorei]|uniref:hypothetical protein n=1 Tax=Agrobacterium larrymoorei TaxID=160699 RepID=UPI00157411B0|nr:hypothetical protein [Agrobacterium larrymoorei]NTJ42027.1 hypothetical protein [Agrobacterium larrymoorei]